MDINALKINENKMQDRFLALLFSIYAILKLSPYFLWATYKNGAYERLFGNFQTANFLAIIIIFFGVWKIISERYLDHNDIIVSVIVLICAFFILYVSDRNSNIIIHRGWINYITLVVFLLMDHQVKVKTFKYFKNIFALTLLPALVWYLLVNVFGYSGNYQIIQSTTESKVANEIYYRHYPGAVLVWARWNPISRYRFCGIYDEPGVIGSVGGLLLSVNLLSKKKDTVINILLFIEGLLSMSLAFIVFLLIYFVLNALLSKNFYRLIALVLVIAAYFIFINVSFDNDIITSLQDRMKITDSGLSGDNRTSDKFDDYFSAFNDSDDSMVLLFGNGPEAIETTEGKSSSYKNIIYDYGYIVFVLFIAWIALYIVLQMHAYGNKRSLFILFILILANIYQRHGLFYFPYMLILVTGAKTIISNSGGYRLVEYNNELLLNCK